MSYEWGSDVYIGGGAEDKFLWEEEGLEWEHCKQKVPFEYFKENTLQQHRNKFSSISPLARHGKEPLKTRLKLFGVNHTMANNEVTSYHFISKN